jgi:hypothetical protein
VDTVRQLRQEECDGYQVPQRAHLAFLVTFLNFASVFTGSFLHIFLWKDVEYWNVIPLMVITTFYASNYLPFIFNW